MPVLSYIQAQELDRAKKNQQQLLLQACEKGDLEDVRNIIETNKKAFADWNMHNGGSGKVDLKWLIDAQCDIYWTPIMIAARYGHLPIVQYLIQEGAVFEHSNN